MLPRTASSARRKNADVAEECTQCAASFPIRSTQHAADQALHEHRAYIELVFARDGRSIEAAWTSIAAKFAVALRYYVLLEPPNRAHINEDQGEHVVHLT